MLKLLVANDNGNSEQDMIINGEVIQQPNVYAEPYQLPNLDELNEKYIAKNLLDNLIVTIETKQINNGAPTTYYVGTYATKTGEVLSNIMVGARNSKLNSPIPLINTLANLAGYAVKKAYEDESIEDELTVSVDMATALPVNQYSKENGALFANRFIGQHIVTVHVATRTVRVKLNIEYVKTIPEGVTTAHFLVPGKHKEIFKEFADDYKLSLSDIDFKDKRILHIAIGEGTTEFPLTTGIGFSPHFIKGTPNGVGHAINSIITEFREKHGLTSKFSRQDFSNALKDPQNKYHDEALAIIRKPLQEQANLIFDVAQQQISRANNDIDYICVYGGGSILMKPYLKNNLRDFADFTNIKVIYLTEPTSVLVEALGLYEFASDKLFKDLKKTFIEKHKTNK
jgi:plasmid segregation protein ParM